MTLQKMQPDESIHLSNHDEQIVHGNVPLREVR
jgi:hypothetical protein